MVQVFKEEFLESSPDIIENMAQKTYAHVYIPLPPPTQSSLRYTYFASRLCRTSLDCGGSAMECKGHGFWSQTNSNASSALLLGDLR